MVIWQAAEITTQLATRKPRVLRASHTVRRFVEQEETEETEGKCSVISAPSCSRIPGTATLFCNAGEYSSHNPYSWGVSKRGATLTD
jgi:hypothetical protein